MSKEITSLADLTNDSRNANKGTPRGRGMVETSLTKYGAGRSILVDKHGQIIAGNKTAEAAAAINLDGLVVVKTRGDQLVVVQREDLDLNTDPAARELAIADNRAGELGLEWDADVLAELGSEIDLSTFFRRDELAVLMGDVEAIDPAELWKGMPEFEQEDKRSFKQLVIHFASQDDMDAFSRLINQTITLHTKSLWHPKLEIIRNGKTVTEYES